MMEKAPLGNVSMENSTVKGRWVLDRGAYQHPFPGDLWFLVPVLLSLICVLGLVANVTAVGVLVGNARKSKLSLINALILNLLLADALLLGGAVPFQITAFSHPGWTLGVTVCKTCDWFVHTCMVVKSFTVAIMAKACYRYVRNPTKPVCIRMKSIVLLLILAWITGSALPVPHWLFARLQTEDGRVLCVQVVPPDDRHFMSVYLKVYPLVAFCAPLSFALLYFWRAYGRCQRRCTKTPNLRAQIRARKLTLMLLGLTVAMGSMWLPQWVAWVWRRHAADGESPAPPASFSVAARVLMFGLSLANPLIVLAFSEEFREGYMDLWRRLTLRKHPPKPGPHAPTAPRSPTPRPEASAHPPTLAPTPDTGDDADTDVLPDVEQFWHGRENDCMSQENDPVPWEHQDLKEDKQ